MIKTNDIERIMQNQEAPTRKTGWTLLGLSKIIAFMIISMMLRLLE